MRVILAFLLYLSAVSGLYSFQNTPAGPPARGAIHGRVLQSKSGDPVKKAILILRRGQETGTGTVADESGKFRFDDIESGTYTLAAERDGFVLDPESERTTVSVQPGSAESEVTLKLVRTGAISGRVLDSDGDPMVGATVQVLAVTKKKDGGSPSNALTDDRGQYRLFNIPPGKYRIAVSYEPRFRQTQVKMQHPRTQSPNAFDETYAFTYYPAALNPEQAKIVNVEAGMDLQGFDVQILRAHGVTVRGTVSAAGGAPIGAIVFVNLHTIGQTASVRTYDNLLQDSSGAFELESVLPGTYLLDAMAPLSGTRVSASRVIDVGNANVEGINLTLAPPQTISGTVILPEGRTMPSGLVVILVPRETRDHRGGGMGQPGKDGVFRMQDVPPGDYDVNVGNIGGGDDLYVSAIQVSDDDALSSGIHVGEEAVGPLKITFKGNGGIVQANVKDARDKPLADAYVRLVPDPPRRAQVALYSECKTDERGTCGLMGVPPGSYHAFAFAEERSIDFRDPTATAEIEDSGKAINVGEGEHKGVDLTPLPEAK